MAPAAPDVMTPASTLPTPAWNLCIACYHTGLPTHVRSPVTISPPIATSGPPIPTRDPPSENGGHAAPHLSRHVARRRGPAADTQLPASPRTVTAASRAASRRLARRLAG